MAIILKATKREDLSRSAIKEIRSSGFIPAVVYGKEKTPENVTINNLELQKLVRDEGRNAIISLDVENGEKVDVMLHEYQSDPLRSEVIHADFYVVDMSEAMDVAVSIRIEGEPEGVREGGILQQPLFELQVRAKPRDIPEEILINVTDLAIGDSISVADLPVSDQYEFIDEADATVVVVLAPAAEEEEATEDVGEVSIEPEVIGAKEEEEEE